MRPSCIPTDGLPTGDRLTPPTAREVIPERPYGHVHHPANLPICVALPPQFYDIGDIRIKVPCIHVILADYPARIVHCCHHPDCPHGQASRLSQALPFFMACSNCSFSLPDRMHPRPFLRALPCILSTPQGINGRLLIRGIATQPRRQGGPFLKLPASPLRPAAPRTCLSLFHAHPLHAIRPHERERLAGKRAHGQ